MTKPNLILPGALQAVKDLDEKWQQLTHIGCGGELVLIVRRQTETAVICKVCRVMWNTDGAPRPEWVPAKPVKKGSGLWVPGAAKGVL